MYHPRRFFSRFRLVSFLPLIGSLSVTAAPPTSYYDSADALTGLNLKAALHGIIDDHTVIPYSSSSFDAHDAMDVLDQDPNNANNVILIYSRRSERKSTWPSWNREHVWPNSLGIDGDAPAYSDLHNLRACDANVNSSRGNEYFDWSDTNATSYAFPAHVEAPLASSDSDSWEPPDSVKGDIARSQFYMAVRYEGDPGEPNLELVENTALINSSASFMGRLSTLIEWHRADPVDAAEQQRHEGVYSYHGNRNPFVDHPEWVEAVFIPSLTITPIPGGVRLRWEHTGVDFTLESSEFGGVWSSVVGSPIQDSQGWFQDLSLGGLNQLYRLRL